jgi:hypothetical protein
VGQFRNSWVSDGFSNFSFIHSHVYHPTHNRSTPTPEWTKESKLPFWTPASKFPLDYMQIGNENGASDKLLEMKKDLHPERAKFWSELRQKFALHNWKLDDKSEQKDEL